MAATAKPTKALTCYAAPRCQHLAVLLHAVLNMLGVLVQSILLCALLIPAAFVWRRYTSSVRRLNGPKSVSFWRGRSILSRLDVQTLMHTIQVISARSTPGTAGTFTERSWKGLVGQSRSMAYSGCAPAFSSPRKMSYCGMLITRLHLIFSVPPSLRI